jgi:ABC-2 type transport system ATP-binding protein
MIKVKDLVFNYGRQPVIRNISLDFEPGWVHGVVGLNGAGKTTFFNLLAGYLKPLSGTVSYGERRPGIADISFLETQNYCYSNITGGEYLRIFPQTNKDFKQDRLNELFHLPLKELVSAYSTGMRKKLALMAQLQQEKPVFILDEPFNGLDLESNKVLELIITQLKAKGKTIFISSHILSPLLECCDLIHVLEAGTIHKTYSRAAFAHIEADLFGDFNARAEALVRNSL